MRNILCGILFLVQFILISPTYAKYPSHWDSTPFAASCENEDIKSILGQLSNLHRIDIKIGEDVKGKCFGWSKSPSITEFMNSLEESNGITWYFFKNTIYIENKDSIVLSRLKMSTDMHSALKDMGVIEKKYGWRYLKDSEEVLLNGPLSYANKMREFIGNVVIDSNSAKPKRRHTKNKAPINVNTIKSDVYIFKIDNASVADRTLNVRGEEYRMPGIATVLKGMFTEPSPANNPNNEKLNELSSLMTVRKSSGEKILIESDIRTNSVVIKSRDKPREYFEDIIKRLDRELELVEIDTTIVDINRDTFVEIGTKYNYRSNRSLSALTLSGGSEGTGNISAVLNISNYANFFADLKMLENNGKASIIANTSILTIENQPALIDLSSTFYVRNVSENAASVSPVTTGTLLNIIPQKVNVGDRTYLKLGLNIEDGTILSQTVDGIPIIKSSVINTNTVVESGKSLVVGGYRVQKVENNYKGIPFFKRIPIMKYIAGSESKIKSHQERLFILTPRIVSARGSFMDSMTGPGILFDDDMRFEKSIKTKAVEFKEKAITNAELVFKLIVSAGTRNEMNRNTKPKYGMPKLNCFIHGVAFNNEAYYAYEEHGITVIKASVVNTTNNVIPVPEYSCDAEGLVAIINTGKRHLQPYGKTYFYAAIDNQFLK